MDSHCVYFLCLASFTPHHVPSIPFCIASCTSFMFIALYCPTGSINLSLVTRTLVFMCFDTVLSWRWLWIRLLWIFLPEFAFFFNFSRSLYIHMQLYEIIQRPDVRFNQGPSGTSHKTTLHYHNQDTGTDITHYGSGSVFPSFMWTSVYVCMHECTCVLSSTHFVFGCAPWLLES